MRLKFLIITLFCFTLINPSFAYDQIPEGKQTIPIALVGGTVHTVSKGFIKNGTIVFDKGKITKVGSMIDLPMNAKVIDVTGKHLYPGLISANTNLGLFEVSSVRATVDYDEVGEITPNVKAQVSFNPDSELIPVTRANGITSILSLPLGELITGQSALMNTDGWTWEDMTVKAPVGLHINWPDMRINYSPKSKKSVSEQKEKISKEIKKITDFFEKAKVYYKQNKANKIKKTDLQLSSMDSIFSGKTPVFIYAEKIKAIKAAVDWAEKMQVRMVLMGGYDSWRVADLLKERNIPVIVTGIHRLPKRRWEPYDTAYTLPAKLYKLGVKFCISGNGGPFHSPHERNLPYHAATASAYGLPQIEALKAISLYPAEILGVGNQLGSLEVGKSADLIITDGDPLEITTKIETMFIRGREVDLNSRHTQLYKKYKAKYLQK